MNARAFLLVLVCGLPEFGSAQPIDLSFPPPDVPKQDLCANGRSLDQIRDTWAVEGWPEGLSTTTASRDIATLRKENAAEHVALIQRIIANLAKRDPKFAGKRALMAEIEALRAAGADQDIRARQLVPELAALSNGTSPQVSRALARYYGDGLGVKADQVLADQYLVTAARLGHPDALLTLASRRNKGTAPVQWDMPAKDSVLKAFKTLITPLNSGVCDRSSRIARAYLTGDLVQKNAELGQAWLRFAADLGDAHAAWKVYELQRLAEEVLPDTQVRIRYLTQAAEAGLPFAQVALGRVYERGALVAQDLERAKELFTRAADQGYRAGLVRLAMFLEDQEDSFPNSGPHWHSALERLSETEDPPAWVFTRLAKARLKEEKSPDAKIIGLYRKAADLGDREAMTRLAELLLSDRSKADGFGQAVDLLAEAVAVHGSTGAAKKLFDAYMCKSADSPHVDEALYWRAQYEAADPPLPQREGDVIAALQSQALYRRHSALELWFPHVKAQNDIASVAFWDLYTQGVGQLLEQQLVVDLGRIASVQWREDAKRLLTLIHDRDGTAAMMAFSNATIMEGPALEARLIQETSQGSGAALRMLASVRGEGVHKILPPHLNDLLRKGDFDALLLVTPYADKPLRVLDRAIGKMPCDFKSAMAVARVSGRVGAFERVVQFLEVAEHLHGDKPWALMHLGEARLKWLGMQEAHSAAQLFSAAFKGGELTAGKRLLALLQNPETQLYDPIEAETLQSKIAELTESL